MPGKKGWGAACPRVCSYLVLRDKSSGKRFCFTTHGDRRPGTDLYPSDHFPVTATIELP